MRPQQAPEHTAPCGALDCRRAGVVVPVIEVPDLFMDGISTHIPMRVHIPLAHCKSHAKQVLVSDLMLDARVVAVCEAETKKLKRRPNWQAARLIWYPIFVREDHDQN